MDIYVARVSGVIMWQGRRHRIQRGSTTARVGHPILDEHAGMFQPLTVHYDTAGVEQATAAPGEKRDVQPKGKKGAKKKDAAPEGDES